jgi:hypothetical protein
MTVTRSKFLRTAPNLNKAEEKGYSPWHVPTFSRLALRASPSSAANFQLGVAPKCARLDPQRRLGCTVHAYRVTRSSNAVRVPIQAAHLAPLGEGAGT